MKASTIDAYVQILKSELVPALGCTEPGAIAYCAAKAADVLGRFPEHITVCCSGNIVKNVKGVVVPNSGGLRGIEAAAILGTVVSSSGNALEVLNQVTSDNIEKTKALMATDYCKCSLQEGEGNLYIDVVATAGEDSSQVIIRGSHTNVVYIRKNKEILLKSDMGTSCSDISDMKKLLSVDGILEFVEAVDLSRVSELLDYQIAVNTAIAEEGLSRDYGAAVGRTLMDTCGNDIKVRAKAKAAAGSDARMGGCSLPVVINSGSGNQGITVTVPVVEYAKELGTDKETLLKALLISNLISIHIKKYIGKLSAFCGAVSAACGSGAAIAYLCGGGIEEISDTIVNTAANVGGMVCDGAKASCAAKVASALDAAIMGQSMAHQHRTFQGGEGLVAGNVEKTIQNIGYLGREGMKTTDVEILHMMLGNRAVEEC